MTDYSTATYVHIPFTLNYMTALGLVYACMHKLQSINYSLYFYVSF